MKGSWRNWVIWAFLYVEELCLKINDWSPEWFWVTSHGSGLSPSVYRHPTGSITPLPRSAPLPDVGRMHPGHMLQNNCFSKHWMERQIDFRVLSSGPWNMQHVSGPTETLQYRYTVRASCSLQISLNQSSIPKCQQKTPTPTKGSALQIHRERMTVSLNNNSPEMTLQLQLALW